MDMEEIKIRAVLDEEQRRLNVKREFENLRPKWRKAFFNLVFYMVLVFMFHWFYPEVVQQPAILVLVILIFGVSMDNFHESRRINKRIDLLHKMFEEDV